MEYSPQQIRSIISEAAKPITSALETLPSGLKGITSEGQQVIDDLAGVKQDFLVCLDYCRKGPKFYREGGSLTEEQIQEEFRLVLKSAVENYSALETEAAKCQSPTVIRYQTEIGSIMQAIRDAVSEINVP